MPSNLQQVRLGTPPPNVRKIMDHLKRHVTPEAPYFDTPELLRAAKIGRATGCRPAIREHMAGWFKKVGRHVWWSTPDHIKKL